MVRKGERPELVEGSAPPEDGGHGAAERWMPVHARDRGGVQGGEHSGATEAESYRGGELEGESYRGGEREAP